MQSILKSAAAIVLMLGAPSQLIAEDIIFENFENQPETRWRFFADTVMGGVSTGQVEFKTEGGESYAHMTGSVSTANNGGFIQIRMAIPTSLPAGTQGVRLTVRGNAQSYFVHLRTSGTLLPWQYYQAKYDVSQDWTKVDLPFSAFEASDRLLRDVPRAQSLKSIGIVAYGRDHDAEIDIQEISFY
ncbi:MAG: hypothetical protein ACI84R_000605 [Candidatus Azotimanducaceae bacterium]|jgi:hypothetical protein